MYDRTKKNKLFNLENFNEEKTELKIIFLGNNYPVYFIDNNLWKSKENIRFGKT